MPVTGIGGFFFRAEDPHALQAWYEKHLGIGHDFAAPWRQEAGQTLFMAFPKATDYFPPPRRG